MHACSEPLRPTGGYRGHYLIFRGRVNLLKRKKLGDNCGGGDTRVKGGEKYTLVTWLSVGGGEVLFRHYRAASLQFKLPVEETQNLLFFVLRHFSSFASLFLSLSLSLSLSECVCVLLLSACEDDYGETGWKLAKSWPTDFHSNALHRRWRRRRQEKKTAVFCELLQSLAGDFIFCPPPPPPLRSSAAQNREITPETNTRAWQWLSAALPPSAAPPAVAVAFSFLFKLLLPPPPAAADVE